MMRFLSVLSVLIGALLLGAPAAYAHPPCNRPAVQVQVAVPHVVAQVGPVVVSTMPAYVPAPQVVYYAPAPRQVVYYPSRPAYRPPVVVHSVPTRPTVYVNASVRRPVTTTRTTTRHVHTSGCGHRVTTVTRTRRS